MMAGVKMWLLSLLAACLVCGIADALMPQGAVKKVGRLVCGLVLILSMLTPVVHLDIDGGQQWLESYLAEVEQREGELEEQVRGGIKTIIEEAYAAYIVDKAAQLGVTCTVKVVCRVQEDGLYLPIQADITGVLSMQKQEQLSNILKEELGLPIEGQHYMDGGNDHEGQVA